MTERTLDGGDHRVLDLLAEDTAMAHHRVPDETTSADGIADAGHVAAAVAWFETIWDTVARPL